MRKLSQLALFSFDQHGCLNCQSKVLQFLPWNIFILYFVAFFILPGVAFPHSWLPFHSTRVRSDFRYCFFFSSILILGNLVPRAFSSTIFKVAGESPGMGWTNMVQNLQKSLSRDFYHVTFWEKPIQNGGKASRENQNSGQNTYLKTCKPYARDIDSFVVSRPYEPVFRASIRLLLSLSSVSWLPALLCSEMVCRPGASPARYWPRGWLPHRRKWR